MQEIEMTPIKQALKDAGFRPVPSYKDNEWRKGIFQVWLRPDAHLVELTVTLNAWVIVYRHADENDEKETDESLFARLMSTRLTSRVHSPHRAWPEDTVGSVLGVTWPPKPVVSPVDRLKEKGWDLDGVPENEPKFSCLEGKKGNWLFSVWVDPADEVMRWGFGRVDNEDEWMFEDDVALADYQSPDAAALGALEALMAHPFGEVTLGLWMVGEA